MAKYTGTLRMAASDDTVYRAMILDLHNAIIGSGRMEQTADTGQVDHTTAVRQSNSVYNHYRIYQLNDGVVHADGSRPMLRVDWARGNTVNPQYRFIVGGKTDGAGNFIGQTASFANSNGWASQAAATAIKASGIAGGFWLHHGWFHVSLEHGWNTDGSVKAPFAQFIAWNTSANSHTSRHLRLDGADAYRSLTGTNLHDAHTSSMIGGNVFAYPLYTFYGSRQPPSKLVAACDAGEFSADTEHAMTHYGTPGNWWRSSIMSAGSPWTNAGTGGYALLTRWED